VFDLTDMDGTALRNAFVGGELSAESIAKNTLELIAKRDRHIHAFLTVDSKRVVARAQALDAARKRGDSLGPLAGVPVAIKDNLVTRELPTTAGSKLLEHFQGVYDAHVIERLRSAGALLVGKTNLDEFAMGSSTENSAYGPTRNPWDRSRIPGGSSGGSAAAVGARMTPLALGSDTGGSIRQPAALCGVVGLKPTWGRVSRYGLIAFASSLDQIGPFGRTVRDVATLLGVLAGHDPRDATSAKTPVPNYNSPAPDHLKGLRVGIPQAYFQDGIQPAVEKSVRTAIAMFKDRGATLVDVTLPDTKQCLAAYYVIAPAEASSNLARYDGVRYGHRAARSVDLIDMYQRTRGEGLGPEVKRRIMLGTYALAAGYYEAYYGRAQWVRNRIRSAYQDAFQSCDVIVTPTSPTTAARIGEVGDPLTMYLMDIFTISANLTGIPALSMPCGFSEEGLPIGVQLLGQPYDEPTLLRIASVYEAATDWTARKPEVDG